MTLTLYGTIVGHELVTPDPKNSPTTQVLQLGVAVAPNALFAEKATKAKLIVELSQRNEYPLGAKVRLRMDIYQGELPLKGENADISTNEPSSPTPPKSGRRSVPH
jgi:hypothetical protein